ncbi:MAG: hypothetical protein ACM32O_08860, partial [Clostridia bacterium]
MKKNPNGSRAAGVEENGENAPGGWDTSLGSFLVGFISKAELRPKHADSGKRHTLDAKACSAFSITPEPCPKGPRLFSVFLGTAFPFSRDICGRLMEDFIKKKTFSSTGLTPVCRTGIKTP